MYAGEIVELSPTEELFENPRHPYTQGLIRSIPTSRRVDRLHVIQGRPPDLTQLPSACPFAPRCEQAIKRCTTEHPDLEPMPGAPDHALRCWNPREFRIE
jgi:oligopeptide/dipeptide ABC transporter ATP-binding protein